MLLCEDPDVLGAPFYVMECVAGTPYRRGTARSPLGAERARAPSRALVDTLVELHAVDPGAVGLGDFGRPEGFLERQVRRWGKQLDASRSRELPGHRRAARAARRGSVPAHGDPRSCTATTGSTTCSSTTDDRIAAVLDWEMSTLGDPLTDLGLLDGVPDARRS